MTKKKSLESVRPAFGSFQLQEMPELTFHFRKIMLDDMVWFENTFGMPMHEYFTDGRQVPTQDLCRIWFHALTPESQAHFAPSRETVVDPDTNESIERVVTGSEKLRKAISFGVEEIAYIGHAYRLTVEASKSTVELPEDVKKNLGKTPNP